VTSARVMTPLAGLSWANAGADAKIAPTPAAIHNVSVRVRMTKGFTISRSFATGLRSAGGRGGWLGGTGRRRRAHRLFGARLGLEIRLLLLGAVQKLFGVVALAGGELAAHL